MAPRLDLISFWQSGHVTSEVNFGLWPHVGGLIEYLSNSSQTIRKYAIPVNFWPQVAVPCLFHYFTIFTVSGLWPLIETFFSESFPSISDHRWLFQPSFIISPLSLFLASGFWLKICNSCQFLTTGGCSSPLSLFHHYHCFWPLASNWNFFFESLA